MKWEVLVSGYLFIWIKLKAKRRKLLHFYDNESMKRHGNELLTFIL